MAKPKQKAAPKIISNQNLRDRILAEAQKGHIVFIGIEGPMVANLEEFVKQPVDGILYDLNRSPEVVLTFIDDSKWVNDYAVSLVIKKLKGGLVAIQGLADKWHRVAVNDAKRNNSDPSRDAFEWFSKELLAALAAQPKETIK
jgi:hypothetical protein